MAQKLSVIREPSFIRGYNDKVKPELLEKGFCADALNCFLDDQTISKRGGYSEVGTDVDKDYGILGMGELKTVSGTHYMLRARNKDASNALVEAWAGTGAWGTLTDSDSQTKNLKHEFVMANDAMYIFNGTDTVKKTTNGTSVSTVAAIPKGKSGKWFHNYFFVFGVSSNPDRLYWSTINTTETYGADDYIDVNPNDGDAIVGLAVLKDELLIFKKNRIWALTGFGATDFTIDDLGERLTGQGAQSLRSIVETENDVYYLSSSGGIPHFRSVQRTRYGEIVGGGILSDPIEGTMEGIDNAYLGNCAGIFDGRKIWWGVTETADTYNELVLVYDVITTAWTRHTGINASCWLQSDIVTKPKVYFGESSATAYTFVMDSSESDNGTAIDMQFKTPMYRPKPESKCKWKYLYITADVNSGTTLDVDYSPDGFTFDDLVEMDLSGPNTVFPMTFPLLLGATTSVKERVDSAGGTAYKMQYLFQNNTTDETVVIREFQVLYKPRGLRAA